MRRCETLIPGRKPSRDELESMATCTHRDRQTKQKIYNNYINTNRYTQLSIHNEKWHIPNFRNFALLCGMGGMVQILKERTTGKCFRSSPKGAAQSNSSSQEEEGA